VVMIPVKLFLRGHVQSVYSRDDIEHFGGREAM